MVSRHVPRAQSQGTNVLYLNHVQGGENECPATFDIAQAIASPQNDLDPFGTRVGLPHSSSVRHR